MQHAVTWTGGFAGGNVARADERLGGVGLIPSIWDVVSVLVFEGGLADASSRTSPLLAL